MFHHVIYLVDGTLSTKAISHLSHAIIDARPTAISLASASTRHCITGGTNQVSWISLVSLLLLIFFTKALWKWTFRRRHVKQHDDLLDMTLGLLS